MADKLITCQPFLYFYHSKIAGVKLISFASLNAINFIV